MNKLKAGGLALLMLCSGGCATMYSENYHIINVQTQDGRPLTVTVDSIDHTVPGDITVNKNGRDKILVVSDDNCESLRVEKTIDPIYFVNMLNIGVGFFIDNATDKMWRYSDQVTIPCDTSDSLN